jgi:hypothetical protein
MPENRKKPHVHLDIEWLEAREAPSVTPLAQSFDSTALGQLPSGWQQWSSNKSQVFRVSGQQALSPARSLASTSAASQVAARTWVAAIQPADVEVSAALFANNPMPLQVLARGKNLGGTKPTYYGFQVTRGLEVKLVRLKDGASTTLAQLSSHYYQSDLWVRVTLQVNGFLVRGQVYRMDTGQYLDSSGRWTAQRTWALTAADTMITGGGQVGFARPASYAGTFYVDDFRLFSAAGDPTAPRVSIVTPSPGSLLSGTKPVRATASDNVAVARVEFYVDGGLRFVDHKAPYEWSFDTSTAPNGGHALTARAVDIQGNASTAALGFSSTNATALTPPSIPRHYSHIRIAQLAYGSSQIGDFEEGLLRRSVDLVVTQGGTTSVQVRAVAPSTPQLVYTNISTLYLNLLTDWLSYADRHAMPREGAFYHVKKATAYSGNSPSSRPVNWFWGVYRSGSPVTDLTTIATGRIGASVSFGGTGQSLYVGYPDKFREINLSLLIGATGGWASQLEYVSGVDSKGKVLWSPLTKLTDTTASMTRSGQITFTPPKNWRPITVDDSPNLFYVRFRTTRTGQAPVARSILGRDYTRSNGGNTGVIPVFDKAADKDGDGYLNQTEWAARAPGKDARFLYESRALYGTYGQMRFATNPSNSGFRAWAVDYLQRFLKGQPGVVNLFMDNATGNTPVSAATAQESVATYSNDFATLVNAVARHIGPRWVLVNTTSDLVVSKNTAYYEEFALRPLAHHFEQFENVAERVAHRATLRTPSPYAVLDVYPQGGDPTSGRTQMAALSYYYLLADPVRTFVNFFGGHEPTTSWTRHWVKAAAYNIGQPLETWKVLATGSDPANKKLTYRVYSRAYGNALVVYKPRSYDKGVTGTLAANTATTHVLPGKYRLLRSDGTLGETVVGITLRNGEGAILVKV